MPYCCFVEALIKTKVAVGHKQTSTTKEHLFDIFFVLVELLVGIETLEVDLVCAEAIIYKLLINVFFPFIRLPCANYLFILI